MGNVYSGYSEIRLEQIQDEIIDKTTATFKSKHNKNINFSRRKVFLPESNNYLHVIECMSDNVLPNKKPVVITHGYGLGGITFVGNMASLALSLHRRILAVDWLGLASSSRPEFNGNDKEVSLQFFLEAFDIFRQKERLVKFDYVGHGLGAYNCFIKFRPQTKKMIKIYL